MQLKFRTKIFLSISIILMLALVSVFFLISPVIQREVGNVIDEKIKLNYNALDKVTKISVQAQIFQGAMLTGRRDLEGSLLTYYSALHFDPSEFEQSNDETPLTREMVMRSAEATIRDTVMSMLQRFDGLLEIDFLLLLDIEGHVLFNQGLELNSNTTLQLPLWDLVQTSGIDESPFVYDGKLYHAVIKPVYYIEDENQSSSNEILGYMITGIHIDMNFIRQTIHTNSDTNQENHSIGDIYITYTDVDGEILTSNVHTTRDSSFIEHMLDHFTKHISKDDPQSKLEYEHENEIMTGNHWKIYNANNEVIAYQLLLTSKTQTVDAFMNSIRHTMIIIAIVTILFGFAAGYFTSRSVTRPVDILVNAANELSVGNMEHQIQYQSKDEMGLLSNTLELMRVSILKRIQQIQSLQDELIQKEKLASIGSIASAINHEIRNQLSFGMAAELIQQKYPKDTEVKTYTDMILNARDYILRMLDDIRNFARSNQNVDYTREAKPLQETLEKTVAFCRFDNELKHIVIEEEYEEVGDVICDHQRIGQVIINLIRNGGHAMEKKGTLHVRMKQKDRLAVIEVQDHGCGIPPEHIEKIWESFFSTKGEKGLGLGLDICKKIMEDHQGKIYCESTVGTGSTFIVELPLDVTE